MKIDRLAVLWGGVFILCAGLGFLPEPQGFGKALPVLAALGFFALGFALIYRAGRRGDGQMLRLLRTLSALSLGLTLVLLVANLLSVGGSPWVGQLLHVVLVIVSSPMVCGQYWAMSLFLWACLLLTANRQLRRTCRQG